MDFLHLSPRRTLAAVGGDVMLAMYQGQKPGLSRMDFHSLGDQETEE